ncbi:MAG: hypothetical protein DMF06_09030 [Verrucomicrobia bacterium]|nr:MAG: hypothetical protein DMF06_09030 [Verrucomicrobiota bacterium]
MKQPGNMIYHARSVRRFLAPIILLSLCGVLILQESASAGIFAPTEEELDAAIEQSPQSVPDLRLLPHVKRDGKSYVRMGDTYLQVKEHNGIESGFSGPRWTNGIVYYFFDAGVLASNRQRWRDATAVWSSVASLTFVELGTQTGNFIYVQNDDGNYSDHLGMAGGRQVIGIFNWNVLHVIVHEIGHALGLIHEQNRQDRDSYVAIIWDNIPTDPETRFQFEIVPTATMYGAYDFDSVMHYGQCAFTTCGICNPSCRTIMVNSPYAQWQDLIGQRDHLSQLDATGMAQRYAGTPSPTPTAPPCGTALAQGFDTVTAPTLPAGWAETNNGGDSTRWVTSTAAPYSAPNDAFIPDQSGISDKYLDTPSITISSASAQVSFRNNFNTEYDPPPNEVFWDGGVLEVSSPNINGGFFTDITNPAVGGSFVSGGYTGVISNLASNPLANRLAWSGNSGGYINTVVNLGPNVNGQAIKLRFRIGTDEATSAPGWRIDNVTVTGGPCGTPTPPPSSTTALGNISTRLRVETGTNLLIGGFIVTGTQAKRVILRAMGPSLPFGGALSDPVLELRNSSGGLVAWNDDWRFRPDGSSQQAEIAATGIPPVNNLESALVATLSANNSAYTAIVSGYNNATGIGVVEAYDLDRMVDSRLGNISTRGFVSTGDNVLIAGTIITGTNSARVLFRAIGPSLANLGIPDALSDPTIELRDANGNLIAFNDDWRTRPDGSSQQAEIVATGIPPANFLESALVATLPANNAAYTAIVRGYQNLTGVALVEAYQLP